MEISNEELGQSFFLFLLDKWKISSGEDCGEPFSFADTPYLVDFVRDDFPFKVVKKAAQARISEVQIAKAIHRAIFKKGNILYTFPAGEQLQQFVDARARIAVINNSFIYQYVDGTLNLKKFSINRNQIYFRGGQKRRQIISVDASVLLADEADEYEDGVLYTLNKRLGAAKHPVREYFSTPSFHGVGVSLYYHGSDALKERGSDQRVWGIKCDSCGKWNEDLLWPDNVIDYNEKENQSTYYTPDVKIVCRHCKKPLDVLSTKAHWIPKSPSNSDYCHGYHVSKLLSGRTNLNQMFLDSHDPVKEQEFFNSDLGEPYEPKGSRLTDQVLYACRGSHLLKAREKDDWCFAGIDIGNVIHIAISVVEKESGRIRFIAFQEVDDWSDLEAIYQDYNILCSVIDANPEKEDAIAFQGKHDSVWLAYYMQYLEKTPDQIVIKHDEGIVHVHRTLMMEMTLTMFNEKKVVLPLNVMQVKDYFEHMKSPVKALKQDIKGDWIPFYPKTRTPDHYFHAVLYNLVAHKTRPSPARYKNVKIL